MGFLGSLIGSVGSIVGGAVTGNWGSAVSGVTSALSGGANSAESNAWQSAENQKQRDWQSNENQTQRDWQSNENQVSRDFNAEQAELNRNWQDQQREAQNEWNSTSSQMERLQDAGVNPWIALGGSGASGTSSMLGSGSSASSSPTSSSMGSPSMSGQPSTPQAVDLSEAVKNIAQADNLGANTDSTRALLEGQISLQGAEQRLKLTQAALNTVQSLNIPIEVAGKYTAAMAQAARDNKSIEEMDAMIEKIGKEAGLADAQRALIQFSLAPYYEAISNWYNQDSNNKKELLPYQKRVYSAEEKELLARAGLHITEAGDIVATRPARISSAYGQAKYYNSAAALNKQSWEIRNMSEAEEVLANIRKFEQQAIRENVITQTQQQQLSLLKAQYQRAVKENKYVEAQSIAGIIKDIMASAYLGSGALKNTTGVAKDVISLPLP